MSPQSALRRVLFGNLMLIAALGGMLVQQRLAHQDSNSTIVAEHGDRQVTLRDSLMSLPGFVTVDSAIIRTAESPVRLVGPTLIAWDDPGTAGDDLLGNPVAPAGRGASEGRRGRRVHPRGPFHARTPRRYVRRELQREPRGRGPEREFRAGGARLTIRAAFWSDESRGTPGRATALSADLSQLNQGRMMRGHEALRALIPQSLPATVSHTRAPPAPISPRRASPGRQSWAALGTAPRLQSAASYRGAPCPSGSWEAWRQR